MPSIQFTQPHLVKNQNLKRTTEIQDYDLWHLALWEFPLLQQHHRCFHQHHTRFVGLDCSKSIVSFFTNVISTVSQT